MLRFMGSQRVGHNGSTELNLFAVKRKKKRGMSFPFAFLRTKKIKRIVSRPEHS